MSNLNHYVRQIHPRTESYIPHVDRIQDLFITEAKIDATKFEGNILKAMGAKDSDIGDYNNNPEAIKIADDMVSKMKADGINISNPKRLSGSASEGKLSKLFLDFGVKNPEAKADISFGRNGISVKNMKSAQLLSAQGPEVGAIVQHVVTNNKAAKAAAGKVADKIPNALKDAFNPDNYYAGRAGKSGIASTGVTYPTELAYREKNKSKDNPKGDLTDKQKKEIATAKAELVSNDKKLTALIKNSTSKDYAKGAADFGIAKNISKAINDMFNDDVVREAIILEAMTGNGKFDNKPPKATYVLSWGTDGSYSYKTVEDAAKNVSGYNFRVSDRGSKSSSTIRKMGDMSQLPGALTGRGGSFRIDILPPNLQESLDTDTENYIDEMANEIGENHRAYLTENLKYTQELLLQEGLWGKVTSGIKNVKDKVMKGINFLVDKIKAFVSKIGKWMMKLVKNTGYYLMVFNMKPKLSFRIK